MNELIYLPSPLPLSFTRSLTSLLPYPFSHPISPSRARARQRQLTTSPSIPKEIAGEKVMGVGWRRAGREGMG